MDPSMRLLKHGPIQPMDRPGFFARLCRYLQEHSK